MFEELYSAIHFIVPHKHFLLIQSTYFSSPSNLQIQKTEVNLCNRYFINFQFIVIDIL